MKKIYVNTIYYFLKSYKRLFLSVLLFGGAAAFLEFLALAALLPVFNLMFGVSQASEAGAIFSSISRLLANLPFKDGIISAFVFLIALTLLRAVFGIISEFLTAFTAGRIMYDTKNKLLDKYCYAPYQFFLDTKQGEVLYNIINAPKRFAQVLYKIPRLFLELLRISAIMALLFYINVYTTVILILLSLAFNMAISHLSNRVSYILGKERVELETQQTVFINELFNGIKQIIAYGARNTWKTKFKKANKRFADIFIKDASWVAAPKFIVDIFGYLAIFIVIVFVKTRNPQKLVETLPVIGIFAMALVRILPSLVNIGRLRMEIVGGLPDVEVMYKTLNIKFQDVKHGDKIFEGLDDAIVFEGVHFAHKERHELLKGIDISFRKNQITAIVGTTGSGKTTIINLVLGLFQPTKGRVAIDRTDLREYKIQTWLEKIGLVSQDTFIFHSTIADNICLGSDKYSREQIIKAAKLSGADEFIKHFPNGYETVVGERGMKLSGGQQQCIAIARAIIRNPQILILDEATSAVDNISEKMLQEAINNASKDRTVIIIAHRLSTIQNADKVVVLKDGAIIEEGSHGELIALRGFYRDMYTKRDS